MATDLLSRIATEDDEDVTLTPDKRYDKQKKKKSKRTNGYHVVDMDDAGDENGHQTYTRNPFDEINENFNDEDDPEKQISVYHDLREEIKSIQTNIDSVISLRNEFNLSTSQKQYQSIMNQLDDIMMSNSKITRKIKNALKDEKNKNDKLKKVKDKKSSSILVWKVNELNSCVRLFKSLTVTFGKELNETERMLKQKEMRKLREFDDKKELNEEKIEYLVEHPQKLNAFLHQKFQGIEVADALLERLEEVEHRHEGMMKIEKSVKELQALWMELHCLVTEQQEHLDHIQENVEQTKHYVQKAKKNIEKSETKQRCNRKLGCCALCLCLVVVILVIGFVGGFTKFYLPGS